MSFCEQAEAAQRVRRPDACSPPQLLHFFTETYQDDEMLRRQSRVTSTEKWLRCHGGPLFRRHTEKMARNRRGVDVWISDTEPQDTTHVHDSADAEPGIGLWKQTLLHAQHLYLLTDCELCIPAIQVYSEFALACTGLEFYTLNTWNAR